MRTFRLAKSGASSPEIAKHIDEIASQQNVLSTRCTMGASILNIRLAMAILVRDEADIIAENIRYHADRGVDTFIVMDNDSIDGTRDILQGLQRDYDLTILDEPSKTIDQDLWVSRMVLRLRDEDRADWIILNDADEFWVSRNNSIKDEIANTQVENDGSLGVIRCSRYNMLGSAIDAEAAGYRFFNNIWKVANPYGEWPRRKAEQLDDVPHLLQRVGPKAICAAIGFRSVGHGNHVVEHDAPLKADSDEIQILHYPIRTYDQFERKVKNYGESLMANDRLRLKVAHHFREWYAMFKEGKLEEEYSKFLLTPERIEQLSQSDVINKDSILLDYFSATGRQSHQ